MPDSRHAGATIHQLARVTTHGARLLIAVVDDDPSILRSLASLLESADYDVCRFESGEALLRSEYLPRVACLISDVDMPMLDGFDLVRRATEIRPGLPAILISGYPEALQRQPQTGGQRRPVFLKPFDGQALLAAVAEAVHDSTC